MKSFFRLLLVFAILGLAACDSNDPVSFVPTQELETFNLQVLHASADAPPVNISLNGSDILFNLDYKDGTQRILSAGINTIGVDGILPGGNATVISYPSDFAADTGTRSLSRATPLTPCRFCFRSRAQSRQPETRASPFCTVLLTHRRSTSI